MIRSAALVALAGLVGQPVHAQTGETERLLISGITAGGGQIIFSYSGDLWRMPVAGGVAERLTSGPEEDDYPVLSAGGGQLAFSRRGADDWDVYVISPEGGEPRRLTYNPEADIARGWTFDANRVLFMSHRDEEGIFRLYTVSALGGFPQAVDLPRGWDGSYSRDGSRLAYVPVALPLELFGIEWRHYRGGMTSPIRILNLENGKVESIPWENSNDRQPMWMPDAVHFVSDRSGTFNLHRYDRGSGAVTQLTEFTNHGIESASVGDSVIVFVRDGGIHVFNPRKGEGRQVAFTLSSAETVPESRTVTGTRWIESTAPSPGGDTIVVEARGDILAFDAADGSWSNLTGTSGAAERYPAMSPDGRWIAYFSDASGEYELHLRSTGEGTVTRIPVELRSSFYRELTWSPDSRRVAFSDRRLTLWVADIETRGARRVITSPSSSQDRFYPAWSPDGDWLAFSMYEENRIPTIYLHDVRRARSFRVTDARVHAEHPVFDPNGEYLYFVASNTAGLGEFGWSVLSGMVYRPLVTRQLHMVMLRPGRPAPLLPIIGERNPRADSLAAPGRPAVSREGPPEGRRQPPEGRRRPPEGRRQLPPGAVGSGPASGGIDPRGIDERIVPLPVSPRDFADLASAGPEALFVLVTEWPDSPYPGATPTRSLYRWDLSRPRELRWLATDVRDFAPTAGHDRVLLQDGDGWSMISATPDDSSVNELDLSGLTIDVEPAAEWRQIYAEAFRLMRGYFYDPNFHGRDLRALQTHYAEYLPTITRRVDLNRLLAKALGQISVSHLGVRGGDLERPEGPGSQVGLLGADYQWDRGAYRITRVYETAHFNSENPLLQAPLDQPGVRVNEGDYLVAVDGETIDGRRNLYAYFQGKALKPVEITVSDRRDGQGARTYTVVPLPGENSLRRMNWAQRNRRIVEEESRGILGYVFIPSFSSASLELIFRQLLEFQDRRGLIIDQRFNGGGVTADYLIEWLRRKPLYYYKFRQGSNLVMPTNPVPTAKVLLINEANASAAETFALMFKLGDLGTIVGTRTLGAGIGPYGFVPPFIDGGRITIPNRAAFDPAGDWGIENDGVEPDLEVPITLDDWRAGRDPQLAAAINRVLQMIVDNPPLEVTVPEPPKYE